jgi:hypothetical protein
MRRSHAADVFIVGVNGSVRRQIVVRLRSGEAVADVAAETGMGLDPRCWTR